VSVYETLLDVSGQTNEEVSEWLRCESGW
jgi:hypothetical protein